MGDMADDLADQEYKESLPYSEWNPRGYKVKEKRMSQDYKISAYKPSDFQDNFGNWWVEVAFEGVSEPARWAMKDPMKYKVGDTVYGHMVDATSRAGKPYSKFVRDQKEEYTPTQSSGSNSGQSTDESIARAVALKAAVELTASDARLMKDKATVLEIADRFLEWLKGTTPSERPATEPVRKSDEAIDPTLMDEFGNSDWASMAGETLDDDLSMGG